ncbi:NAD(+) synthase [Thiohalomonas denitrificans]|uniref:NH(3)-dependent NAD(+) synthetase n=1 Tax=Thiohalomonas denitrificans TaxID=415747 RepID=A0A1G5Q2Y5_9GAMM|nr:NAD(+) synthase [Thiohalomonas denitrificans]SCZ55988.1 NAD+ synthase [Thiohalomonas denitrificans]
MADSMPGSMTDSIKAKSSLSYDVLQLDPSAEAGQIGRGIREHLRTSLKRRGMVLGLSGGVDSSVCAALAVEAVGPERVFALLMPEDDSSGESLEKGRMVAEQLGIRYEVRDITATLQALGCYQTRDDAIRRVFPEYGSDWRNKIVIRGGTDGRINHFNLVVESPDGELHEQRLRMDEYLEIVAATNFKQRVRKMLEYHYADRFNYAVVGTPNRLEYELGFFVKNGDGSADLKPIAHLYKTQVYALAEHFDIPESIRMAPPSTDTYSLSQSQDEFYFALPYGEMDLALWAYDHGRAVQELGNVLNIGSEGALRVYADIEKKRQMASYLHAPPLLCAD